MRITHGTWMKSGNLIIIHIRGNKSLPGVTILNNLHMRGVHVVFFHPIHVGCKVLAHGCHRD